MTPSSWSVVWKAFHGTERLRHSNISPPKDLSFNQKQMEALRHPYCARMPPFTVPLG